MSLFYDLFSILVWLGPSAFLLAWFYRRAQRADQELKARTEANAAMFVAQVQAQMGVKVPPPGSDEPSPPKSGI